MLINTYFQYLIPVLVLASLSEIIITMVGNKISINKYSYNGIRKRLGMQPLCGKFEYKIIPTIMIIKKKKTFNLSLISLWAPVTRKRYLDFFVTPFPRKSSNSSSHALWFHHLISRSASFSGRIMCFYLTPRVLHIFQVVNNAGQIYCRFPSVRRTITESLLQ